MHYKKYGKTHKKLSVIGCGGMRLDESRGIDAGAEVVLHAYERGINYFDTAPSYCGGKSEEIFGAAIRQMKPGTFHISTKSTACDGKNLRADLEHSLKRLNVERIDFYHIWYVLTLEEWGRRKAGGAVAAALKAKDEGLIGHLAISSHMPGCDIGSVLREGYFDGVTLGYCAINFPYREEGIESAEELGLGVVTMNPLGGGVIPQNAERFDFLRGPGDESVVVAALRFNVSHPAITCALVGFETKRHVDEAVEAVEDFQPYSQAHIDAVRGKVLGRFGDLCTCCGYCLPCPVGLAIPRMMDAYNMKILHGGDASHVLPRLISHWGLDPADAATCTECGLCEERCTQKLPIRERMKEIAEMMEESGED